MCKEKNLAADCRHCVDDSRVQCGTAGRDVLFEYWKKMVFIPAVGACISSFRLYVFSDEPEAYKTDFGLRGLPALLAFLWLESLFDYDMHDECGHRVSGRRYISGDIRCILLFRAGPGPGLGRRSVQQKLCILQPINGKGVGYSYVFGSYSTLKDAHESGSILQRGIMIQLKQL